MKILPLALATVIFAAHGASAHDHAHEIFAAGLPGTGPAADRTIDLTIREQPDGRMGFGVGDLHVARGEKVRFVITNAGKAPHEFRLDSKAGNAEHGAMMAAMPGMVHHDANAVSIAPGRTATLVWRFTKPGDYEFACLLPGHYQAGMHGTIVVGKLDETR